ncbi:hypothetical protein J3F84DRAFT_384317 [Trichoderma pleuroticola]
MKPVVSSMQAWSWYVKNTLRHASRKPKKKQHPRRLCWGIQANDLVSWFPGSTVISFFAIIILSVLALLYRSNHEQLMGSVNDPTDGKAVSRTVFTAVFVYIGFLVFCGLQGMLHVRENRRGAISL